MHVEDKTGKTPDELLAMAADRVIARTWSSHYLVSVRTFAPFAGVDQGSGRSVQGRRGDLKAG